MIFVKRLTQLLKEKYLKETRGSLGSEGQAIIEATLLLIIVVSIILGLLYQFNARFTEFTKRYFGDYVTCILETGELPSLGGQTEDSPSDTGDSRTCNAMYAPFSAIDGRPLIDRGSVGTSSGSGANVNGSNSSKSSSTDASAEGGGRRAGDRGVDPEGSGRTSGSDSGSNNGRVAASGSRSRFGSDSAGGDSETRTVKAPEEGAGDGSAGGGGPRGLRSRKSGATSGETGEEYMGRYRFVPPSKEEQEKPVVLAPAKVSAESDKNSKKGARVPTGKSDRERMGQADDEPFVLNLPNMIRYLLIAGIAIAIGLFLGGQFMAIRKGAEKN